MNLQTPSDFLRTSLPSWIQYLLYGVMLLAGLDAWASDNPIELKLQRSAQSTKVYAVNTGVARVSLYARLFGNNLASDRAWPQVVVINPGASVNLGNVRGKNPRAGHNFDVQVSAQVGDYRATGRNDLLYRLPYPDGQAYPVSQAIGGKLTSHSDPLMQQAIDFSMPEGTGVIAARDGVVIEVQESFTEGGQDAYYLDKANRVVVQHADGTIGMYAHLLALSAKVAVGEHVSRGQLLALSGNTGYSSGPHLHFALMRPVLGADKNFRLEALPVYFYAGFPARVLAPVVGMQASANYDQPAKVTYLRVAEGKGK